LNKNLTSLLAIQAIIDNNTLIIRNKRVLLDMEVARLYDVDLKHLRNQIEKEKLRFSKDFMFQLTTVEYKKTSNSPKIKPLPYAFTESGIMMIGGVLNTKKAIKIHIQVIKHFVQLFKETTSKEIFTLLQQTIREK
jgi:phage regulator Rha-like protein